MHEPTYRKALGDAWRLVAHHNVLWVLGILAIFSGQFGMSNFVGQLLTLQSGTEGSMSWNMQSTGMNWLSGFGWVWILVIVLALIVAVAVLSVAAQGALITASAEWYHTKESPDVASAWHRGVKHFWRLLAVAILRKAALIIILIITGYWSEQLLMLWNNGGAVATITLLTAGLLAGLFVVAMAMYTSGYVVMEERTLGQAIARAWNLLHRHLLVSLEISLLLLAMTFGIIIAVILVSSLAFVPSMIAVLATAVTGSTAFIGVGLFTSLLLLVCLIVFVGGFYNAYATSVWMYLFMKMHHEGVGSRMFRWFGKLAHR